MGRPLRQWNSRTQGATGTSPVNPYGMQSQNVSSGRMAWPCRLLGCWGEVASASVMLNKPEQIQFHSTTAEQHY